MERNLRRSDATVAAPRRKEIVPFFSMGTFRLRKESNVNGSLNTGDLIVHFFYSSIYQEKAEAPVLSCKREKARFIEGLASTKG